MYAFISTTAAEGLQPSVIETALDAADGIVNALAPDDGSDRSLRVEPLRKQAEKYLAMSEIIMAEANRKNEGAPPLRIFGAGPMQVGADNPTGLDLLEGIHRTARLYREQGFEWLAKCKPITFVAKAGSV